MIYPPDYPLIPVPDGLIEGLAATGNREIPASMAEMTPAIRPLGQGDLAGWTPLWQAYLAFYATTRPEAVHATTFARLTDHRRPDMAAFVAEAEGALIGLVHYLFHATTWGAAPVCYLQDLFTLPARRGGGVAGGLIAAVGDAARAQGASGVYWLTAETNATARAVYDRVAVLTPLRVYEQTL